MCDRTDFFTPGSGAFTPSARTAWSGRSNGGSTGSSRTGTRRARRPSRILLDWASHAVSDSTRFFETPDTSDYTFRPGVDGATGSVSFPSAMRTRYPENNTVHALYFQRRSRRSADAHKSAKADAPFSCFRNGMPVPTVTSASAVCSTDSG